MSRASATRTRSACVCASAIRRSSTVSRATAQQLGAPFLLVQCKYIIFISLILSCDIPVYRYVHIQLSIDRPTMKEFGFLRWVRSQKTGSAPLGSALMNTVRIQAATSPVSTVPMRQAQMGRSGGQSPADLMLRVLAARQAGPRAGVDSNSKTSPLVRFGRQSTRPHVRTTSTQRPAIDDEEVVVDREALEDIIGAHNDTTRDNSSAATLMYRRSGYGTPATATLTRSPTTSPSDIRVQSGSISTPPTVRCHRLSGFRELSTRNAMGAKRRMRRTRALFPLTTVSSS